MILGSPSRKVPEEAGGVTYEGMEVTVSCDVGLQISFGIYRQISIYGKLRQKTGGIIRDLCRQKGVELHEATQCPIIFTCS